MLMKFDVLCLRPITYTVGHPLSRDILLGIFYMFYWPMG